MSTETHTTRTRKPKPKTSGIGSRVVEVIEQEITHTRLSTLEKMSGIGKTSWGNALSGLQKTSHEMIEWTCRQWPQYAYWIATGSLPVSNNHTNAKREQAKRSELTLKEIFKKEPADWSENEEFFVGLSVADATEDWISGKYSFEMVYLLTQSRNSSKTLKQTIEKERAYWTEKLSSTELNSESDEAKWDIHSSENFEFAVAQLKACGAKTE